MSLSEKKSQSATIDRVYAVADRMVREGRGREISARTIYEEIQYGSMKTINDALASWWEVHGMQVAKLEQLDDLPPEIVSSLIDVVHELGNAAKTRAQDEYEAMHLEARQLVEKAETAQLEAIERLNDSESRNKELQHELRLQLEKTEHLSQDLAKSEAERQAIGAEIKQIRQDASDNVIQAEKRVQELELTLTRENRRFDEMQNHYAKVIDEERTARKQEALQHQANTTQLTKDMSELQSQYIELKSTAAVQEKVSSEKITQLQSDIEKLSTALDQAKEQNIALQNSVAGLTAERNMLETSLAAVEKNHDGKIRECNELQKELAAMDTKLKASRKHRKNKP